MFTLKMKPETMKSWLKLAVSAFIVAYLFSCAATARSQETTLSYAYIAEQANGSGIAAVNFIDLNDSNSDHHIASNLSSRTITLAEPFAHLKKAKTSPNGQWLAMLFNQDGGQKLDLIHLAEAQIKVITIIQNDTIDSFSWSPDSRYLGFIGYPLATAVDSNEPLGKLAQIHNAVSGDTPYPLYLYATDTFKLTSLGSSRSQIDPLLVGSAEIHPGAFTWSADSEYIAVANLICYHADGNCQTDINLVNIQTGLAEQSIATYYSPVCFLALSPNHLRISFISICDDYLKEFYEVFTADFISKHIVQITTSTNVPNVPVVRDHFVQYSTIWYDDDVLLVSVEQSDVVFGQGIVPRTLSVKTLAFDYRTQSVVALSKSMAAKDFLNTKTGILIFRSEQLTSQTVKSNINPVISEEFLTIAQINGEHLKIIANLPAGCNPTGSPNHDSLAYENPKIPLKGLSPLEVCAHINTTDSIFITSDDHFELKQYRLPENSQPAGWAYISR